MFRTKRDVDRHVQEVLRKVKNENERNLRCYNIAQQYYKVRDYESAKNYLSLYLSVKEDSPLAHKLQGQIWEGLDDKVRALNAYKTSLEYEANQPELVLKMCELLCDTDIAMDTDRAHYWCERGADLFPHDPAVFRLKEKLLKLGGKSNTQDFEELINSEMKARPNDVSVRTRLMRLYLETGRTEAAFNHALELEATQTFHKELVWYECFARICQSYADEFPNQMDWQFYCTWVSVLDRVASLSMCELSVQKKLVDCVHTVFSMDQVLFKAASITAPKEYTELYKQFTRHMSAQLCMHIGTLIFKRAKKEPSYWREATRAVSIILCLALSPPPDTEASWCIALKPNFKQSLALWASDAYYRVSQAGYILLGLSKDASNQFTEKVIHMATGNWRERIFQRIFMVLDHRAGIATSHFVHSELLAKVSVRLPTHDMGTMRTRQLVPTYEKVRDTLHHLVWLGLETTKYNDGKIPPDFHTYSFTRLKMSTHLSNMSPETLSVLDIDAFLYATVLCAAAILEEELLSQFHSSDRPVTLPADISNLLCTKEQTNWWISVCQVNSQQFNNSTNLIVLRQQLQRGLEVIRVDGSHGLDVLLIVKLARTFADRAASVGNVVDQTTLENRALLYWNAALPLLEKMERNQAVHMSKSKLFEYPRKELSMAEICSLLEEGRYFVACQHMKSEQYDRAIEAFKSLRSPYASFNQALIYKKLAAAELEERPKEEITSEMRSKHVILLSKARECLNLTWERIRIDRRHPLHQTLPEHISEVETALSRIEPDPDMVNRSDGDANISELSVSSVGSPGAGDMGQQTHLSPKLNGRIHKHSSTPRRQHHTHSEYRRPNNGELIDVGQLLQIQTLHDEIKKVHEKLELIMENMNEFRRDVNRLKPTGAEDLYLFGDEEEYPEDVLSGQYQPPFVPSYSSATQSAPSFYPPPSRGVQGTSTVTYGAPPTQQPPVIPLIPMRVPLDPALSGYQTSQNLAFYNQGALPFTDPQLSEFLRQNIPKPVPPPPVNVVITTSDTLPTGPPPVQPTLSVTIPPQHRLGTLPITTSPAITTTPTPPHKFQIPMPATATIPTLQKSPIIIPDEVDSEDDNEVAYDPCPDFRPIIPLPNEVNVTTGEEDDDVLFVNKAKLFRFIDKEWKERGVGTVKILKNRASDKVRLVMRRDQVHKVCANHLLKSDMELTMLKNSDRALVWVANDFTEEVFQVEKFCIKFKTSEEALRFRDVFNDAKFKYGQSPMKPEKNKPKQLQKKSSTVEETKKPDSPMKVNVGGFTFTSPPNLKEPIEKNTNYQDENKKESQIAPSPFAAFTFTPQKPEGSVTTSKSNFVLKPSVLTSPLLFAGLNSTQNKHTLFQDTMEDVPVQLSPSLKDSPFKVPNETSQKIIVKDPVLTSFQTFAPAPSHNVENNENCKVISQEPVMNETVFSTQKSFFNVTPQTTPVIKSPKDTPKSILKDPLVSSLSSGNTVTTMTTTTPVSCSKSLPAGKHVLFQDTTLISPSQQTPTLAALLTAPKTQVVDFAAVSKMNENKAFQNRSDSQTSVFEGAGSTVFGGNRKRNESEGENVEEFIPSAEFKPVIPLPELVEVKTGEESEIILFNERAKLMRFDADNKEWKERGLGQMKVLKDPATGITRFLMRREQVFKVCCNHRIIQSLELKASPSSEKAWTWYAVDYSEGETKNELFAIRFKTVELAKKFKETVDKVQKQLREEGTSKRSCPDSAAKEEITPPSNVWNCQFCLFPNSTDSRVCKGCPKTKSDSAALPKLSELFRPKKGSWECKACYTINGVKDITCVSCGSLKEKPKSPGPVILPTGSEKTTESMPSLTELFKPKEGSWECNGCLVRNDGDKTVCVACSNPKPGHENYVKDSSKSSVSFGSSSFSFGFKPADEKGTSFSFGMKPIQDTSKSSFVFGIKSPETTAKVSETTNTSSALFNLKPDLTENKESKNNVISSGAGFTFGQSFKNKEANIFTFTPKSEVVASSADSTTESSVSENKPKETVKFGDSLASPKFSFMFGATTTPDSSLGSGDKFAFGKSGKFEFNFSGVKIQRSPGSHSGNKSPRSPSIGQETDSEPDEEDDDETTDHIVFQPVVPLPDKVPLTTGEEDEMVLYSHRAKLYRFAQGEWKERGVGDIKILQHNITRKIRLLMRREPILKICLNHFLTTELSFSPKDDRSWLWSAKDFADGQLTAEQFCLRFKTPEIAAEFKATVDSAQGELEAGSCENTIVPIIDDTAVNDTQDLEIVYEVTVSEELRQAALKLQLPPNFYSYLNAASCPGCVGCEPESEEEEDSKSEPTKSVIPEIKSTVGESGSLPITTAITTTVSQPFTFTFKTTGATPSNVFDTITTKDSSITTYTPVLPTSTNTQSGFSFSLNFSSTPTTSTFSSNQPVSASSSTPTTSFFGGSPIFQSQSVAKPSFINSFLEGTVNTPMAKAESPLLFGTTASTQSATTLSFGSAQNATPPSIFGGSTSSQVNKGTPLFNITSFDSISSQSMFGGASPQIPSSVFGTPTTSVDNSSSKGTSFFNNQKSFQSPQTSLFGDTTSQSPALKFGTVTTDNTTTQSSVSGGSQSSGGLFTQTDTTNAGPAFLFKHTTTFSDIKSLKQPFFQSDEKKSFSWAGAGTKVFDGKTDTSKESGSESEGEEDSLAPETAHDPTFEPIVPLPDMIEVRTGEEDEEKVFCYRAKFYRYDTDAKEWKERGVGDMKVLRHREANTYRLLLRRDQVHKVVCNQLITSDMELQFLANSDKSYCWAGMNMAEEYREPQLEKVAVRFKTSEIALDFKAKVDQCIDIVRANKKKAISEEDLNSSAEGLEPVVTIEEVGTEYSGGEDCEGEYLDEEENPLLFSKRATLYKRGDNKWDKISHGELNIEYTHVMNMVMIIFKKDNGEQIAMSAGPESNVQQLSENEVTWCGQDYVHEETEGQQHEYKAEFSTSDIADEFLVIFSESMDLVNAVSVTESEPED